MTIAVPRYVPEAKGANASSVAKGPGVYGLARRASSAGN